MLEAILFDLDNTLLVNPLKAFASVLFQSFTRLGAHLAPPEHTVSALLGAVEAMDANEGGGPTNEEVFSADFCSAAGYTPKDLADLSDKLYAEEYPKLRHVTRRLPHARPVIECAFERGLKVAIATGMQGPRTAVEQRLHWAGVPATEFDYALLTTWSNMHASKPHPAYYREVLAHLNRKPDECLMVGDDWDQDIFPATSIGIPSYWIMESDIISSKRDELLVGQGTLSDLWVWLRNADFNTFEQTRV